MRRKSLLTFLFPGLLVGALNTPAFAGKFSFALIGDLLYSATEEAQFPNLINDINKNDLAFVAHDGDFKSGSSLCSDATFQQRFQLFQTFKYPFIFIFGDNEWTDCHRPAAGGFDPLERLAKLRQIFTQGGQSLGKHTLRLTRQSDNPRYSKFRENVRWTVQNVVFVGLNLVGSNNNHHPTHVGTSVVGNLTEYTERNAANLAWLQEAFARQNESPGVMIIIQANPYEVPTNPTDPNGFTDFLVDLQEETIAFGKPVVLVHGDSHYFRIDKPMRPSEGLVAHFTRVETFGTPDVHWVRGTVDFGDPNLFSFKPELVEENQVDHLP